MPEQQMKIAIAAISGITLIMLGSMMTGQTEIGLVGSGIAAVTAIASGKLANGKG